MAEACIVCGHAVVYARGRCRTCYLFVRNPAHKGADRTEDMIVRAERRAFDRELMRRGS